MYKVVIVPFPLTPLSAFGYFLYQGGGEISPNAYSVYHWRPTSDRIKKAWQSDDVLVLTGRDITERLDRLIQTEPKTLESQNRRRLLHLIASPSSGKQKENIEAFARSLNTDWSTPQPALMAAIKVFAEILGSKQDPRLSELQELSIHKAESFVSLDLPRSQVLDTLPKFDDTPAPNQKLIGYWHQALEESNIGSLTNQHLSLVVGGPPGSGKTTATVTLVDEMNNLAGSLRSRLGWEEFNLSVGYVNLDLGTPVGNHIVNQQGQNRELLESLKQKWTPEKAEAGLHAIMEAKKEYNIVVADLPGRIDGLTRMLSCGADGSLIFSNKWELVDEWKRFFAEMGQPNLTQAFTRPPNEGLMSSVKVYRPGSFLSGRVCGLVRVVCSWDPFLKFLAKALLFDLLPALVASRQKAIQKIHLNE